MVETRADRDPLQATPPNVGLVFSALLLTMLMRARWAR